MRNPCLVFAKRGNTADNLRSAPADQQELIVVVRTIRRKGLQQCLAMQGLAMAFYAMAVS